MTKDSITCRTTMPRIRGKLNIVVSIIILQCMLILFLYAWRAGKVSTITSSYQAVRPNVISLAKSGTKENIAVNSSRSGTPKPTQQPLPDPKSTKQPSAAPKSEYDLMKLRQQYLGKAAEDWSDSYRAQPKMNNRDMEVNKVTDDYSYCPRTYPFLESHPYIKETRSPCWWDKDDLRCLPYFFLVGFSKCGTSDLFFKLGLHPDVRYSGSKEKHWFDYQRFTDNNRFINNYTDRFRDVIQAVKNEMKTGQSNTITGDGTPCYAWGSLNWPCYEGNEKQMTEPLYTNADVIYRLNPNTKILMLLREPVKRLHSRMLTYAYQNLHPAYKEPTAESFYNHVAEGIAKLKACFQRWTHRECAYNGTLFAEVKLRLAEGMYNVYVKDWVKVFPKDQILILRFEDYVADTPNVLQRIFSFLNLAPVNETQLADIVNRKPANTGRHYDLNVWTNKTIEILEDFYRPFARDLAEFLRDERFAWHYGS